MPSIKSRRLDSWKSIADYLGRSVRTVFRWSDERGLPVHRVPGGKRHAVFAYSNELDAWLASADSVQPTATSANSLVLSAPSSGLPEFPSGAPVSIQEPVPIEEVVSPTGSSDVPPQSTLEIPTSNIWGRNNSRIMVGAFLLVCFVASIFDFTLHRSPASTFANARKVRIAILPVRDLTGDHTRDVFADGLTGELITQLEGLNPEEMAIIARTSSMFYKDSAEALPEIARELGVDYVLESSIRGNLNQFKFNTQLLRTRDQSLLWTHNYDGTSGNLYLLESALSQDIARELGLHTTVEASARRDRSISIRPDSLFSYLQGRYFWNLRSKEGLDRGFEFFQRAINEDPKNARAYSGMADSYNMLVFYGYSSSASGIVRAEESAHRALELDPSLAEAHASLAYVNFMWTWEWSSAEREFRRAIELDANYVPAHHWYALYLASMGRRAEADREIRTAVNLDPLSSTAQSGAGYVHYFARDYDLAIQECQSVLQRDPDFSVAHSVLGMAFEGKGQYAQAISEFRKADELIGGHGSFYKGLLGHAYAVDGNSQAAQKMLADLDAMAIKGNYASQASKAIIYAGMGEKENALDALERARDQNDASLIWLGVDSRFDLLRSEPGFQELLRAQHRTP
jgi:TolB-like protein/Flp pilus assembly protein TadD